MSKHTRDKSPKCHTSLRNASTSTPRSPSLQRMAIILAN